jgi:hypothetical protein
MAIEMRSATDVLDKLKGFKERNKLTGCGVIRHINVYVEFINNEQLAHWDHQQLKKFGEFCQE